MLNIADSFIHGNNTAWNEINVYEILIIHLGTVWSALKSANTPSNIVHSHITLVTQVVSSIPYNLHQWYE